MIVTSAHGRVAITSIDELDDVAEEAALAAPRRAARAALRRLLPTAGAIGSDDRGAPILPPGWVGSLTHKGARAAALLAPDDGARLGVDLEVAAPPRLDIGRRVLTDGERARLRHLDAAAYGRAVTLRFSIKEAIYKAVDPFVRRYVGFTEVELDVDDARGGPCGVRSQLSLAIDAWWCEIDGYWLATARALSP